MSDTDSFQIKIITPEKVALDKKVTFAKLPGETGEVGILKGHTASLLKLHAGKIRIHQDDGEVHKFFIPHGFSQVLEDHVIVLTPYLENVDHINVERAEKAKKRALERLHSKDDSINLNRARKSLFRAERRIYIDQLHNKKKK